MVVKRRRSRIHLTPGAVALVAAALVAAFRPRPALVDIAEVQVAPMVVTIDEAGRTRVREPYVVSSPVAGKLQRVTLQPGDRVAAGALVAQMRPPRPAALDLRTSEQARVITDAAQAALRVAQPDPEAAQASRDYADSELNRIRKLVEVRIVVWERADALTVASGALFRNTNSDSGGGRSVFAIRDGRAVRQPISIGRSNGTQAQLLSGLGAGDRVVLFPSASLRDGARVAQRHVE